MASGGYCLFCTAENKVFFRFTEGDQGKVHSVPLSELLTVEELPLSDSADIVGMKVLAPWYSDTELTSMLRLSLLMAGKVLQVRSTCTVSLLLPFLSAKFPT